MHPVILNHEAAGEQEQLRARGCSRPASICHGAMLPPNARAVFSTIVMGRWLYSLMENISKVIYFVVSFTSKTAFVPVCSIYPADDPGICSSITHNSTQKPYGALING
jgi:hypothetical protein